MGDAQVFLVRVWRQLSQFRASVRGVGQEQAQLFVDAQQLGAYLHAASAAGLPPVEAEGSGAGCAPSANKLEEKQP